MVYMDHIEVSMLRLTEDTTAAISLLRVELAGMDVISDAAKTEALSFLSHMLMKKEVQMLAGVGIDIAWWKGCRHRWSAC